MSAYWDDQADTIETAMRAVWSEDDTDFGERQLDCVNRIEGLLQPWSLPRAEVLEIGCGMGRVTFPMAYRNPSHRFAAIDISQQMIDRALEYQIEYSGETIRNVKFIATDTVPVVAIGGAYSMLVFQHLDRAAVKTYIRDVAAVLVPGGRFAFQFVEGEYHSDNDHRYTIDEMAYWCFRAFGRAVEFSHDDVYPQWKWAVVVKR